MNIRAISEKEMQFYLLRGRRLRAEAMHLGVSRLAGRLAVLAAVAGAVVENAVEAYGRHRLRRQAVAQLSALSDHSLADIGVRREEIPFLVEDWLRAAVPNAGDAGEPVAFPTVDSRPGRQRCSDLAEAA